MITFSQYLDEARSAPLYHYASAINTISICNSNVLKAYKNDNVFQSETNTYGKNAAFFTRSFRNAQGFATLKGNADGVIFEVDQQKISYRYKLEPIHNWHKSYYKRQKSYDKFNAKLDLSTVPYGVEYEEIVNRDINDFLSYVKVIHYMPNFADNEDDVREILPNLSKYPDIEIKKTKSIRF